MMSRSLGRRFQFTKPSGRLRLQWSSTIATSAWSHFGHSNNRSSHPSPAGDIRASIMTVWHFEQRGRSIALGGNLVGVLPVMVRYNPGRG
jgi:hypothetical protein